MKRWRTWAEVKAMKDQSFLPKYPNSQLVQKAVEIACELAKLPFVLTVALFGSTARDEDGHDIDLLVIDDGTVSNTALGYAEFREERRLAGSFYEAFPVACLDALAEHTLLGISNSFWDKVYSQPMCQHIIFANREIITNQSYLDRLIRCGHDFEFWSNIQDDLKLFNPMISTFGKEMRSLQKLRFVNDGKPGTQLLKEIGDDLKLQRDSLTAPRRAVKASPASKSAEMPVIAALPDNTFEVIGGQTEAKYEVMGLASALNNPERYAKWGTKPPRGIMLYGPPGTGKTLLAKALSKATKTPFYEIDASQIITKWYGESAQNVDKVFEATRKTGGIIFFDEADSLASNRKGTDSHEESRRVVAALCRNMDGFKTSDRVVVFFATNRPEDMDDAVKRAGRTDLWIEVPLPDRDGRREIFSIHIRKAEGVAGRKLFTGVDLESLLDKTEGYSGADIAEIIRRSLEAKVRAEAEGENPTSVTVADILAQITRYERVKQAKKKIGFTRE